MSNCMRLYHDRFNSNGIMYGQEKPVRWGRVVLFIAVLIAVLYGARLIQNYRALKTICKQQPADMTCQVTMRETLAI